MDIQQLLVSFALPIVTSLIAYFTATKKSKENLKSVKLNNENEIKKIKETYEHELSLLKEKTNLEILKLNAQSEIKDKESQQDLMNSALGGFLKDVISDPIGGQEKIEGLMNLQSFLNKQ